ncbi:IclR family transcriptional regulator C-terminal domain-containing protein [Streptomyces sp. B6B3]|uniref:IclR family transcriptional regulator n=1 Tax=Streptomyces sp. B6B3 TaxID=3153570 RepID=UPI00325EE2F9
MSPDETRTIVERELSARLGGTSHAERVFRVQQAFAELGGDVHGPGELAERSGLDDSAVFRILQSGVYQGVFERVGRGRYRLGMNTAYLGMHALAHAPGDAARAALERLREATDGGLAMLYALAPFGGAQRQCIDMAVGDSDLLELGMTPREVLAVTRSLRTGASGRSILAYLPETIQRRVLAEPVPDEAGPGAYRDNDALLRSLQDVRDQGYAIGLQECTPGWNSCAAPIMWNDSIMGSALLLKPTVVMPTVTDPVIAATKTTAAELSRASSGPWPTPR